MFGWDWQSGSGEEGFENYLFIFYISQIYPLRNESGLSFEQILISFIQECNVPSSVETGSVVLEKIL